MADSNWLHFFDNGSSVAVARLQLPYPGLLYITDRNSCFKSEVKETTLILPHADIARADKVAAAHNGAGTLPATVCHATRSRTGGCQ